MSQSMKPQMWELLTTATRTFVPKTWGWEDWIFNNLDADYCMKVLFVKAGKCTSIHRHHVKDEVLLCSTGRVFIEVLIQDIGESGDTSVCTAVQTIPLATGEAIRLHPGTWHRILASQDAYIYEASTGHDDMDVERAKSWKELLDK